MVREYGSNFEYEVDVDFLPDQGIDGCDNVAFLSNGRECLYSIGESHTKNLTVLMPALCCPSMVQPFKQLGRSIHYYALKEDLTIDIESLGSEMSDNSILLIMHYYGRISYDPRALQSLISHYRNVIVIQDCTQHCFSPKLFDNVADYYVGSIRKWLGIPDGAFVKCRRGDFICSASDPDIVEINRISDAMQKKALYLTNGDAVLKQNFRETFSEHMQLLKGAINPHRMSDISGRILKGLNINQLRERRRSNYDRLLSGIDIEFQDVTRYCVKQECPLCLPIIVQRRDDVQHELAQRGIYTQVLWPLPEDAKGMCVTSDYFFEHMLAVPIDQRYSMDDMDYISGSIVDVLRKLL